MNDQELKTYYNILTDAWKIIKKYRDIKTIDWDEALKETTELADRYNRIEFAKNIATEVYQELGRLEKQKCGKSS